MRYRGFNLTAVWLLIVINLLLFIATFIKQDLILILGLQPASFLDKPWTIVTNLFIHAPLPPLSNIWHILGNMVTLYFFGSFLCRLIGVRNFLITYFCGGILGNIFYILLASPYSIAIGASGAIFALGGVLTAMRPRLRVFIFPIPAPLPLWAAVIGGFLILSFFPHVAWQAHLGGLVFGLVMGYFFRRRGRYYF
jgi:membrane associated rhomboid family serine protease